MVMNSDLLSLGGTKCCGELTGEGTEEFSMVTEMFFDLFWWWFT